MGVSFSYISYDEKFYKLFEDNKYFSSDKILFVFVDNRMKEIFTRKVAGKLFSKNPVLVTFDELKERIFLSDKIVLKEAKRILAFFKSIPEDVRKELEITSYFDIIDFANNFFAYYRELNLSCNTSIKEPHKWQERYLEYFHRMKISFDEMCKRYNYIPSDWLESMEHFNKEWIKNFETVIFIDIVEFPKLYRDIIYELGEKSMDISLVLQMKKEDFDEKNLKLKKVSVPEIDRDKKKIDVYIFKNELQEAISLIEMRDAQNGNIYSPAVEKNIFYRVFPNDFAPSKRPVMDDTKLFKFLNIQLQMLMGKEEKLGKTYLLNDLLKAFESKIFKDYYEITNEEFIIVNNLQKDGFKYISREIINRFPEDSFPWVLTSKIENILYDLDGISTIKDVETLYLYFKEVLNLEKFLEEEFDNKDILEKFLEIFGIIKANEKMAIYSGNEEIFGKKAGEGLYRLLIQYMKDLVIKSNIKYDKEITLIKPLDFIKYVDIKEDMVNYFIDITDDNLPKGLKDTLIFTEAQKKEMGIVSGEEKRDIEKYRFYQSVNYGEKTVIFTQKDEDGGVGISPFLEEIINKNGLEIKEIPVSIEKSEKVIATLFSGEGIAQKISEDEIFKKEIRDFDEGKIKIGAYDLNLMRECQLKFYFSKMHELDYVVKAEDKDLDPRILGIIVHKVLERIVQGMWKNVLGTGKIEVSLNDIVALLKEEFKFSREKIQVHMDNYIYQILIPILAENISKFFKMLNKKYENSKITRFQSERGRYEEDPYYSGHIDIYLTGRADLIIETPLGNSIIDYKTGNSSNGQLDYYSIILYGDENSTDKAFFNVWSGEYKKITKPELTKSEMEEVLGQFSDIDYYLPAEKKSTCSSCEYAKICRRER